MEGNDKQPLPSELDWDNMKDGIFDKVQSMKGESVSTYSKKRLGILLLLMLAMLAVPYIISTSNQNLNNDQEAKFPKAESTESELTEVDPKEESLTKLNKSAPKDQSATAVETKQTEDQPLLKKSSTTDKKRSKLASESNISAQVQMELESDTDKRQFVKENAQANNLEETELVSAIVQTNMLTKTQAHQASEEKNQASNPNVAKPATETDHADFPLHTEGKQLAKKNQFAKLKESENVAISQFVPKNAFETSNPLWDKKASESTEKRSYSDSLPQDAFDKINPKQADDNNANGQANSGYVSIQQASLKSDSLNSNDTPTIAQNDYFQIIDSSASLSNSPRKPSRQFIIEGGLTFWDGIYPDDFNETAKYETPLSSFQVQASYLNDLKNDYFLMTGIQFQRLESRFKYSTTIDDYLVRYEDTVVQVWRDLLSGQEEPIYGDVEQNTQAERRVIHHNSVNLLKLSIAGGKSWQFNSFQADVYLGGVINVLTENEGRTLYQGEVIDYSGNSNALFQNQWAVDVISGARLHYFLDQEVGLIGGFQLQQSIVNWSNQPEFNSYPFSFGLQFGISYRLK